MKKQLNLGIIGCTSYVLENLLDIFSVRSDVFKKFIFFTNTEAIKGEISKHFDDFSIPTSFVEDMNIFVEEIDVLIIGADFSPDAAFMRRIIQKRIHIFIENDFDFCESSEHKYLYDLSLAKKVVIVKNNLAKYHVSYKNLESYINMHPDKIRNIEIDIFMPDKSNKFDSIEIRKMIFNRLVFLKKIYKEMYVIKSKDFDKKVFVAEFSKANVEVKISFSGVDISNVVDSIKYRIEEEERFHSFRCKEGYTMTSLSHLVHNFIYRTTAKIMTDKDELVFPRLLD